MTPLSEPFFVVGLATRTDNESESDPTKARLPDLWERVYRNGYLSERMNTDDVALIAVLTDYESDQHGAFTQIVGIPTTDVSTLPEGVVTVAVPKASRHHVVARGTMPAALISSWQQIWSDTVSGDLQRTYQTDYEVHTDDRVDIYLSTQ